jgi:hypothetical protein
MAVVRRQLSVVGCTVTRDNADHSQRTSLNDHFLLAAAAGDDDLAGVFEAADDVDDLLLAPSTSLTRTGPMYCMSSAMSCAARSDMFLKIFCLSSSLAVLSASDSSSLSTFLEHRLDALVVDEQDVLEDEHEPADLLDEVRVLGLEALP